MGELVFYKKGIKNLSRWSHLLELCKLDAENLVKITKLMEVSVYSQPL